MRLFRVAVLCALQLASLAGFSAHAADAAGKNTGGAAGSEERAPSPSGRLNFQTDLFTGRLGYSVPFDLAPARHGGGPGVALRYGSSTENGWAGVGWDLDLGHIQRDTKRGVPVKWSANGTNLFSYDDAKGFIFSLNGQAAALVNVASNEFRAEIEGGFLKFILNTNANQWEVTDTSGNRYYFGQSASARMGNSKVGWSSNALSGTFRWALEKTETVLGDTSLISYTTVSNRLYPSVVAYNGHTNGIAATNTVEFLLADRGDIRISLMSGYRVDTTKRLAAVVHKVAGQLVWSNRLAYVSSLTTSNSLLSSVTRYGTNATDSLPPVSFGYSQQTLSFQSPVNWTNLALPSGGAAGTYYGLGNASVETVDMDGDGLPDRVVRPASGSFTNWLVQRNTGGGFADSVSWGPLGTQTIGASTTDSSWTELQTSHGRLLDINGDGRPDRVVDPYEYYLNGNNTTNYARLVTELNDGGNLLSAINWTNASDLNLAGTDAGYRAVENNGVVRMIDMNGDGLADRVMRQQGTTKTLYFVQFNTGGGFTGTNRFGPYSSQNKTNYETWSGLDSVYSRLIDINGDGLPDRVMCRINSTGSGDSGAAPAQYQTNYVVELNNGVGFEAAVDWPGVNPGYGWACGGGSTSGYVEPGDSAGMVLRDMNGDGLPDRLIRYDCSLSSLYTYWALQINTGNGFGPAFYWSTLVNSQSQPTSDDLTAIQSSMATLMDINGDGLLDRVSAKYSPANGDNYLIVEKSTGPFPDLLNGITNGVGGSMAVTYKSSTQYDNRETNTTVAASSDRIRRMLPFPMQTVSTITESDGIHSTNTTSYTYEGGYWNASRREFNGFAKTTVTDPLGGSTAQYFHQSGGRDNSAFGEYLDTTNSLAKKGVAYRTETRGTNGLLFSLSLQKVEESTLSTGRAFAYVTQSLSLDYPAGNTNYYRATAGQSAYDLASGVVTNTIQWGEVTNVTVSAQTFSDIGNDSVYQATQLAALSNPDILGKPERSIVTADGTESTLLRESKFAYDGATGNLLRQLDRICAGDYRTNSFGYDSYGNQNATTNAAGIVTTTSFDTTYRTFPVSQTVAGSFTTTLIPDVLSGSVLGSTDPKGLVVSNRLDAFRRPIETLVSSTANGAANIWQSRKDYGLGGIVSGASKNFVRTRVFDGVDSSNGHETWVYFDGIGRPIQQRTESETNGYRVVDTRFEQRGLVSFITHPYFSGGTSTSTNYAIPTGTKTGVRSEFDALGRANKVSPADSASFNSSGIITSISAGTGDSGAPIGPALTAYEDGNDPWSVVVTDPESKVHKYRLDAFGRTNQIVEPGTITSTLSYDRLGQLTNTVDAANNKTSYAYNDLGELVAMADPDLGAWTYALDRAGRIRTQTDANGNTTQFNYSDALGRLTSRLGSDKSSTFRLGVTNVYDSGETGYTVYPGQLFSTSDNEGWVKFSYDHRGRVLKSTRYLAKTATSYTTLTAYDDADQTISVSYPASLLTVTNAYDSGRNLVLVKQQGGSGTSFFQAGGFNEFGQLLKTTFGNAVVSTNDFYPAGKLLKSITTTKTTNLQSLAYSYDKVANVKGITDAIYSSGAGSGSFSSLNYDDLHRLVSLTHPSQGVKNFGYTTIGNTLTNDEHSGSTYSYGSYGLTPHAVKTIGTNRYAYDANGNMTTRNGQRLSYDVWNRLAYVSSNSLATVVFGYDGSGSRVWKQNGTNLQVWVASLYEEKQGKAMAHIFAGSKRIATVDSLALGAGGTNEVFHYYHPDHLGSSSLLSDRSGNPVERTVFSAYGREWNSASTATIRETHRYTGQPLDDETGLYFYGFRYYDPQLARFIQPDSIIPDRFNPQTWNRFSYVRNNPLKYTDPTGHADQTPNWESSLSSDFHNLADPNAKGAPSGTLTYGGAQMSTVGAETRNGIAIATIDVGQAGTKEVITTVVGAKAVQLTAKGVAKVAEKVAEKAPGMMERIGSIYRKFKSAEKAAEKTLDTEVKATGKLKAPNLNNNDAVSDYGLYEIETPTGLEKIGKADLERVTLSTGLPTRLHQQVRKLEKIHGKGNVKGAVVEELGETTTAAAKAAENARIRKIFEETGKIPPGNEKSFKP